MIGTAGRQEYYGGTDLSLAARPGPSVLFHVFFRSVQLRMKFIELSGKTLQKMLQADEMSPEQLEASGVTENSIVRVNQQGDIEVRRPDCWDVIGGLLGDFDRRLKHESGLDWA